MAPCGLVRTAKVLANKNFLGQLSGRNISNFGLNVKPLPIGFLGAPFDRGQPHGGLQESPDLLRKSGLIQYLQLIGHTVKDEGDVVHLVNEVDKPEEPEKAKNFYENLIYNQKLSDKVYDVIRSGQICVTVGGDHSVGLGTVHGHAKAYPEEDKMCLLWVDAHGDIETPEVSPSKNMHGMPVSFHIKEMYPHIHYPDQVQQLNWFKPYLRAKDVAFIGLRDVLPCEILFFRKYHIPCFTMREVDVLGIREVTKRALDLINPGRSRPLHVSFDIDALDPLEAPATGTRASGGLSLREGLTLMEDVHLSGCLRGLDLVEVNPALAKNEQELSKTVDAAKRLILAALGFPRGMSAI